MNQKQIIRLGRGIYDDEEERILIKKLSKQTNIAQAKDIAFVNKNREIINLIDTHIDDYLSGKLYTIEFINLMHKLIGSLYESKTNYTKE